MKRFFVFVVASFFSGIVLSTPQWSQAGYVTYMSLATGNEYLYFQLSTPKASDCSGRFYLLKIANDPVGESLFGMLLAHKATNEKVMVYTSGNCLSNGNPEVSIIKTAGDNTSY